MLVVLGASLLLQIAAAVLALRLIRVTGQRTAWVLIASAILLMAVRRGITFVRLLTDDAAHPPDVTAELVALTISILMVIGIGWIAPLFQSVKSAEQEVRQLLEGAPDAMVIADEHDRIRLVNAQAVRLFGYFRGELMGKDVEILIPGRFRESHRARRARYHENPQPRTLGYDAAVFGLRKDGSEFPVEISVSPLETAEGTLVVSSIRDITARRMAEAALQESEGRYHSLLDDVLETSSVGVCILDDSFRVVWVNRAFESYFGLKRREVVGADGRDLVRERLGPLVEDPERFRGKVLATYENNTYREHFECHVLPHEKRLERWLEHWSQPIESGLYKGGRIEHYAEVSERKEQETRIRQFMHIARNMQIGLIVYRQDELADDRSLRIIVVNPEGERLIGIAKEELLDKRIDDAFPMLREHGIPELISRVLRSGDTEEVDEFVYGDDRVKKSGWSFKAFPLPDQCVGVVFERVRSAV